jgi:ABC-2 type transport system ATP-binding protein
MTCNRAIIINEGEIVAVDTVDNLEKGASGKTAWDVLLKPADSGETLKILDELPEKAIADRNDAEGLIKFRLELSSENEFDRFFAKVSSTGGIFRQISPVRATLEDVFIKLTRNEERRDEA